VLQGQAVVVGEDLLQRRQRAVLGGRYSRESPFASSLL
jgi:hypothetical protein